MNDRTARWVFAIGAAIAAFSLAWLGATIDIVPMPWYLPLEHRWAFGHEPLGLAMGFYGALFVATLAALLLGALAWVAAGRFSPTSFAIDSARLGLVVLAIVVVASGWAIARQSATPLSPPAWYCPR